MSHCSVRVPPSEVHERLAKYLLIDGYRLVLDAERSHGSWLVDARDGREFLDLYTHFASAPLGANPPGIVDDPDFMALLARVAASKPVNSDIYTTHLAEFVETFARVLGDPALPHLFFVEGGALAVENALKTAFDWKSRRNEAGGRSRNLGTKVLHLTRAFHGRSGYTMSLTNTDPAKTGRHLQSACLELGGKNPMVVTPSAELDLAVEAALFSGFGTAGQRCTSLGTVIVHESVHDDFIARFDKAARQATIGDPFGDVVFGPMLDEKFAQRFEEFLDWIQPHHTVLGSTGTGRITTANPREGFAGDPDAGIFCHPTIVDGVRQDDAIFLNETFGPIVGVTTYRDLREAIRLANIPGYGLSSSIYTADPAEVFAFRRGISAGMVSVNNSTSGAEAHLPFGGNGKSGNGSRQSGMWVLDQFTRWQSMNWDYSGRLQKAQMDVTELTPDESFRLAD
jgi:Aldehyde dehydrogenase family/Aminotransferase class-III